MSKLSTITTAEQTDLQSRYRSGMLSYRINIQYQNDAGGWTALPYLSSVRASYKNKNNRKTTYQFIPPSEPLDIEVLNYNDAFTTGKGGDYDGVLVKNRKLRLRVASLLRAENASDTPVEDQLDGAFYRTKTSGSSIVIDTLSASAPPDTDITPLYDSETYDDSTYAYYGTYKQTYDIFSEAKGEALITNISATCNSSSEVYVQWRLNDLFAWSTPQLLSSGANEIAINEESGTIDVRYLFDTESLASTAAISNVEVNYLGVEAWFDWGTFEIYETDFLTSGNVDTVKVKAYPRIKRVYDKTITTEEYTGSELVSAVIKDVLGEALDASDYSIPNTTTTIRNPYFKGDARGYNILNELVEYLQTEDNYRLQEIDGVIKLVTLPDTYKADFSYFDKVHFFSVSVSTDASAQLSYVTVLSDDNSLDAVDTYAQSGTTYTKVDLITPVTGATATGDITYNFKTSPINHYPAINIEPIITTSGDYTVSEKTRDAAGGEMVFIVAGTSGSYNLSIKGNVLISPDGFVGEAAGDGTNQRDGLGKSFVLVNEAIKSNAEAKALADYVFNFNSAPKTEISADVVPVVFSELNDNDMIIVSKSTDKTNVQILSEITLSWRAGGRLSFRYKWVDNSQDFAILVYDAYRRYDDGEIYDVSILPSGTTPTIPKMEVVA